MNGDCDWYDCPDGSRCCGEDCCGGEVLLKNGKKRVNEKGYIELRRKWHESGSLRLPCGNDDCTEDDHTDCLEIRVYRSVARFEKDGKVKYESQMYLRLPNRDPPRDDY